MNSVKIKKTLLVGIGNNGRSDDALGWKFLDAFADRDDVFDRVYRYQLQIEDAELISKYERVVFIDATRTQEENGFTLYPCRALSATSYTTHKLNPGTVLWLAGELFCAPPSVYILAISGINWKLNFGISAFAETNFKNAVDYFKNWVYQGR